MFSVRLDVNVVFDVCVRIREERKMNPFW